MIFSLVYMLTRCLFGCLMVLARREVSKDLDFETASAGYGWLNRCVAVGSAVRRARAVIYDAYRVT